MTDSHATPSAVIAIDSDEGLPLHGVPVGPDRPGTAVSVLLGRTASGKPVFFTTSSMELLDGLRTALDAATTMLIPQVTR